MTANAEDGGAARRGARAVGADVDVVVVPSDDSWARDTAPTFVVDGRGGLGGVDWRFNAYGGIYEEYGRTRGMARRILDLLGARRFAAPLVLEGGAVHVDGEGTRAHHRGGRARPAPQSRARPRGGREAAVRRTWAPRRWSGSPRRSTTTTPAATWTTSPASPRPGSSRRSAAPTATTRSTRPIHENLARLRAATDARGRALEVVELPMPARPEFRGRRLSPSYVNFYVANGGVVMPAFGDPADDEARDVLAGLFPRRAVVQVPTLELAKADGNIHCVTQQQPVA